MIHIKFICITSVLVLLLLFGATASAMELRDDYVLSSEKKRFEKNGISCTVDEETLYIDGSGQVESLSEIINSGLETIKKVSIGKNITTIGPKVLESELLNLVEFEVAGNNPYFFDENGVLFAVEERKEGTGKDIILKRYPQGKRGAYTIPEGTTTVESGAFDNCRYLESVSFPVQYSGEVGSFNGCSSLESIHLMDSKSNLFSLDGVLYRKNGYNDLNSLVTFPQGREGKFTVPDMVDWINPMAFEKCSLTEITVSGNVWGIGDWAFQNSKKLERISISGSVRDIYYHAFRGCYNLKEIDIAENNPYYRSIDGVVFNKDLTTIYWCPQAKTGRYEIPYGVTDIGMYAFHESALTSLTIPNSVSTIEFGGHGYDDAGFLNDPAPNVTDIYYQGTEKDWNQIIIQPMVISPGEVFPNAVIHFAK